MHQGFLKTLLIIITTVIMTLLVLVISVVGYVWYTNPYGIKDIIFPANKQTTVDEQTQDETQTEQPSLSQNFEINLSDSQKEALDKIGIKPETLPTQISQDMMNCFTEKLGQQRTQEIIGGATPDAVDLFKARTCVEQ